jgi:hypothetical protein
MTDNWLFDGEGVEWSDCARAQSLQNQQQMLRHLSDIKKQKALGGQRARRVEGSQCPHCGGMLPVDAPAKRYPVCMHCRNELIWFTFAPTLTVPCHHCGRGIVIIESLKGHPVTCLNCKKQSLAGVSPHHPSAAAFRYSQAAAPLTETAEPSLSPLTRLIGAVCVIIFFSLGLFLLLG